MQQQKKDYIYLGIIAALCGFFFFLRLGAWGLFDVDEPRYAEAAREMIESGNWITPYFNYVVRFDKPVFFYWLIALAYKVFGVTEFAARLPSAIMATITIIALYFFGRKHVSKDFGALASITTLTSIQFFGLSRMSITDMTLSAFISLMLMAGFTAIHEPEPRKKYYWYAFYTFMALGMLTKGPVVPALAVLIFFPYALKTGLFLKTFKSASLITGSLLFLLISAPWYILVILENGQPYIDQFFLKDNFQRFTSTVSGHDQPVYFFIIVVMAGFLPWSIHFVYALERYLVSFTKEYLASLKNINKTDSNPLKKMYNYTFGPVTTVFDIAPREKHLLFFSLGWFLIIFIFFSLSGTKLLTYVLPLFPALGLITAFLMNEYIVKKTDSVQKPVTVCFGIQALVLSIAAAVVVWKFNSLMPRDAKVLDMASENLYAALALGLGSITAFVFALSKKQLAAFIATVTMILAVGTVALYGIVPKVNNASQGHLNTLIHITQNYPEKDKKTITYGVIKPSITFYTRQRIEHIYSFDHENPENASKITEVRQQLNDDTLIFVITRVRFLDELSKNYNVYIIDKGRRFALVSNQAFDREIVNKLLAGENK